MPSTNPTTTRRDLVRTICLVGFGTTLGGIAIPRLFAASPIVRAQDVATPELTQTREAELDELHALRTQVAQPVQCTPAPTDTPIPATATATVVPATAAGSALQYGDSFEITILGIAPTPAGGAFQPQGQLLRLNMTILNTSADPTPPPYTGWLLIDAGGQTYPVSTEASNAIVGGRWALAIPAGEIAERAVIFDVLPNAGTTFTLESRDEPTFRVALAIESRG